MTLKAKQEIEKAEVIIGYKTYVKLIQPLIKSGIEVFSGEMGQEIERARTALKRASDNQQVVVISSGDPGVYGMAGLVLEVATRQKARIPIEVLPGVTAATATAAKLGAPLVGDFAVISLSDILTPWNLIERRLRAAAESDFVIVLYNPQSKGRKQPLVKAHELLLEYCSPQTPVGIVKGVSRKEEETTVTSLRKMLEYPIDMATTIIVGNSTTYTTKDRMVTPRGYNLD